MERLLLYSIAYLLTIFFVVHLLKKNRHRSDVILAIWLVLLSTVYYSNNKLLEFCLAFSHCVFIYIYVRSIIKNESFRLKWLVHFIPFLVWTLVAIFYPQFIFENLSILYGVILIYLFIYSAASIKLIVDYKRGKIKILGTSTRPNTLWLYTLVIVVILGHLSKVAPHYVANLTDDEEAIRYAYIISYSSILLAAVVCGVILLRLELSLVNKSQPQKNKAYSTYSLSNSDTADLEKKLIDLMNNQKIYLIPDLTLKDLSNELKIAPHNLSFLLNTRFNQSFYEFINNYRLEAVKTELINPSKKHLSIFAIAYDCGFNSQSTFNRVFKQKMKISPSKYRSSMLSY